MHAHTSTPAPSENKQGLLYWAQRVIAECENAAAGFDADPVHDLRVAIRRCRSMADGLLAVDPEPGWKQLKRLGKPLFAGLGELRDVQVMIEWVQKLAAAEDPGRVTLLSELLSREERLKATSQQALSEFDRKEWLALNARLADRMTAIPLDGSVFQSLAVERWTEAHDLHRKALRNRSGASYHALRIGVKRLRYTVENFLPSIHELWSKDLRTLQDALGELHDFDVLWGMLRSHPEISPEVRQHWRTTLERERDKRLAIYRERMLGRNSLWRTWRAALPSGEALRRAGIDRFCIRANFLDPEFDRSRRVAEDALNLHDSLAAAGLMASNASYRDILEAAALVHGIGRRKREQGHRKRTFRMLLKLPVPPGWSAEDMKLVAIVARYQDGPVAPATHGMFTGMPRQTRTDTLRLSGVLRLAAAIDAAIGPQSGHLQFESRGSAITIRAAHLNGQLGPAGERLARAKYLLETTCGLAIKLQSLPVKKEKPEREAPALPRKTRATSLSSLRSISPE